MKPYTHVLVDLGHVLIKADVKKITNTLKNEFGISENISLEAVSKVGFYELYCTGKISSDEYYKSTVELFTKNGFLKDKKLYKDKLYNILDSHILYCDFEVLKLIEKFKSLGKKIIIVTDTNEWQSESFRRRINFDDYADKVYESHIFGILKNNAQYFYKLLDELKVDGKNVILMDDKEENNILARKENIHAPIFVNAKQFEMNLKEFDYL